MSEQFLDNTEIHACFQEMSRVRVPQRVHVRRLADSTVPER
jgi:hypothetical protein